MGGTALSPLEQLGQSVGQGPQPQQTAAPSQSQLSPLEQLGQSVNAPPSGPTDAQKAYRQATASGPYAPAGGAERAMGQEFGDNTGQAKQALQSGLAATGETAAGITGAQIPGAIAETLPAVIPGTIAGLKAIGQWADAHPVHAVVLLQALKEFVPGFRKMTGLVKAVPGE